MQLEHAHSKQDFLASQIFSPHRYVAKKPHAHKLQKHIRIIWRYINSNKTVKRILQRNIEQILINLDEKHLPILPDKNKSTCKQVELLGYIINREGRPILIRKTVTYKNIVLRIQNDSSRDTY